MKFHGTRGQVGRLEDGGLINLGLSAINDFPPEFEQFDIGGATSPQLLAGPGQVAALDLRVPELRLKGSEGALRRLGTQA